MHAGVTGAPVKNREEIRAEINAILRGILGLDDASAGEVQLLDGQGLDSVAMVDLLATLEDRFALSIPPAEVKAENFRSVATLVALVESLLQAHDS